MPWLFSVVLQCGRFFWSRIACDERECFLPWPSDCSDEFEVKIVLMCAGWRSSEMYASFVSSFEYEGKELVL